MDILKKLIVWAVGLIGILFVLVWLVLSSSLLSGPRASLAEWLIGRETGQSIEISGGVTFKLGSIVHLSATDLRVPSKSTATDDLAQVAALEVDLALGALLQGNLRMSNLTLDGADVVLAIDEQGVPSWPKPAEKATEKPSEKPDKSNRVKNPKDIISSFLTDHKIQLQNSGVVFRDAQSGFEFDLHFDQLSLARPSTSGPVELRGQGALNGQALTLDGDFPMAKAFAGTLTFDGMQVQFDGTPEEGGYDAGFRIDLTATIDDLRQVQKILRVNDVLDGTAEATGEIVYTEGKVFVGNAKGLVSLADGQSVELERTLGPSGGPNDATLDTMIRLFPEDNEPPSTTVRRDLKLVSVYMQLANRIDDVPLRKMVIATNGFVIDTSGVGPPPVTVSGISRSADGLLQIGNVTLRIGPTASPFLVLEGAVNDALQLDQVDIHGDLTLPVASLLAPEVFQGSKFLGEVSGGFRLTGSKDKLSLSELDAALEGTDLWGLQVGGSVGDVLTLNDIDLALAADVASGAKLLKTMGVKPIDTGTVKIDAKLSSDLADWDALASVSVAESQLGFDVSLDAADPNPIVQGSVTSDLIRVEHIRDLVAAAIQIGRLDELDGAPKETNGDTGKESADTTEDAAGPFRDVTLLPLGRAILLSGMDLNIAIDLKKLEGEKGSTSLKTDLMLDGSNAQIGPVEFSYGGGHFNLTGAVDLKENPDALKITGSTGGWDLGAIMQSLHFKKGVSGILNASLDLTGDHSSVQKFMATASGWTTVSMRNGSIETQLLDIAGLGVLPWLFSKGKGERAPIVCLRAPLHVANGKVASKEIVVETDVVQIVVYGDVNLAKKTLDIHGQPRRIGKPLARSPWPFTISGALSDPKVKVKDGPRKVKRTDGASTMPKQRKTCVPDILQLQ